MIRYWFPDLAVNASLGSDERARSDIDERVIDMTPDHDSHNDDADTKRTGVRADAADAASSSPKPKQRARRRHPLNADRAADDEARHDQAVGRTTAKQRPRSNAVSASKYEFTVFMHPDAMVDFGKASE